MKTIAKLSMIALAASLMIGCATQGDVDGIQSQIDNLNTSVSRASADASAALAAANDASSRAAAAEAAANRAAEEGRIANEKLDRYFAKIMRK